MIKERGKVLAVKGCFATIAVERGNTCQRCSVKSQCGSSLIARFLSQKPHTVDVLNTIDLHTGESVIVALPERHLVTSAALVYLLPLLAMFFASAIVSALFNVQFAPLIGAVLGLVVGFLSIALISQCLNKRDAFAPKITRAPFNIPITQVGG